MDGLEYLVQLKEQMSGPAAKATEALRRLELQTKLSSGALSEAEKDQLKYAESLRKINASYQSDALNKRIADTKKLGAAEDKANGDHMSALSSIAGGYAAVAAAAVAAAVAIAGISFKVGSMLVEAQEFKGDTLDALELLTGSADEAVATFQDLDNLSKKLPLPRKQVFELGQELTLAGIDQQKRLEDSIENIANLAQLPGGSGDKLKALISKSLAGDEFKVNAKALVGTGVNFDELTDELSKTLGKSRAVIKTELEKGKIHAEEGIDAINAVLKSKIGGIAVKQMGDVGVQWTKLTDEFQRQLESVNIKPISLLVDKFFELANRVMPYVGEGLNQVIIALLKTYIYVQPIIRSFLIWVNTMRQMTIVQMIFSGLWATLKAIAAVLLLVWAPFALIAGLGALLVVGVVAAFGLLAASIEEAWNWFKGFAGAGITIATDFVMGFVNGIRNGAGAVKDAVVSMGTGAVDAIKGVFDSHSPSRLLMSMGKDDLMGGLAMGIDQGGDAVTGAMAGATMPSLGIVGDNVGRAGQAASNNTSVNAGGLSLNINGVKDAQDLQDVLPDAMADLFEQFALQLGGSTAPGGA